MRVRKLNGEVVRKFTFAAEKEWMKKRGRKEIFEAEKESRTQSNKRNMNRPR